MRRARNGTAPGGGRRASEIDWVDVRRRLAGAAIRDGNALTPEQAEAVLAERARSLAVATAPLLDHRSGLEAIVVRISDERYAVAANYVWRVVGAPDIAPVPGAPAILAGVMNLHGEVLPVFDPRLLLGLAIDAAPARIQVIVLGSERAELGLVVDAADSVARLTGDELHAPPDSLAPGRRDLLRGVTRSGLILLDGAKLLADPRLGVVPG